MKRALVILMTAAISAAAFTGCIPETSSTRVNLDPDFSEPDKIELDFVELNNDTIAAFGTVVETPYTFVTAVSIDGSNDDKSLTADVSMVDGADEADAQHFAAALLRHMNDAAADQYTTFEPSSSESFGNLYDSYSVNINITNEADGSEVYVLNVPAGEAIDLDPDIESYEEEWAEYAQMYNQGLSDEDAMLDAVLESEAAESSAQEEGTETQADTETSEDTGTDASN